MRILALMALLAATPVHAGGLILSVTSGGLLVPALESAVPAALPSCTACDKVRPELSLVPPVSIPPGDELLAEMTEPLDRAAREALHAALCDGLMSCLAWHPGGLQFSLVAP